jgi:hypothetical protein
LGGESGDGETSEDGRKTGIAWVSVGKQTQEGALHIKEFAKSFYCSKAWKETRKAYAKSKGGLCERCLKKGLYVPGVIVHHKVYLTPDNINDPAVSLNWNNLELVCRDCHAQEHDGLKRRYKVDELGRITAVV